MTAQPLYKYAHDADEQADESCLLVSELGDKHTGRDTHYEIGNEVP